MLLQSKVSKLNDVVSLAARLAGRRFPDFVYGGPLTGIPVFCFHEAEPVRFERELAFLARNGYHTLTMEAYLARVTGRVPPGEREALLTFDDGWSSLWSIGLPLLKRYGMTVVLFLAAGRIEEGGLGPTLEDAHAGRGDVSGLLARDRAASPFITWEEARALHASGRVDLQSHSMTHTQVFCRGAIEDFVRPGLLARLSATRLPEWMPGAGVPAWGRPLYYAAPRLALDRRYLEDPAVRQACECHVAAHGGPDFFSRRAWRRTLLRVARNAGLGRPNSGRFETPGERDAAFREELAGSKRLIESQVPGATVKHFCFPWDVGTERAMALAHEAGYASVCVRQVATREMGVTLGSPVRISRFSHDWLFTLPGDGRRSCWEPVGRKITRWASLPFRDGKRSARAPAA